MSCRLVLAAISLTMIAPAADAQSTQVGFEREVTRDGVEVGIWYPASGTPVRQRLGLFEQEVVPGGRVSEGRHPLVVISHGTGGDFAGHVDTAEALARAGFVVAALTHPGDNRRDNSRASRIEGRPAALSATITYMIANWPHRAAIDPGRIGAFGFSAGGFTVLAAAGGRPDLGRLEPHCRQHPTFFDCKLLKAQPRAPSGPWPVLRDPRIRAIVVAAPALGFTFTRQGLADLRMPVQLWRADADEILPYPLYADAVQANLPRKPEFHTGPNAGHFDFLAPCLDPEVMPHLCKSAPGFDRSAFHERFNRAVVSFFSRNLAKSTRSAAGFRSTGRRR